MEVEDAGGARSFDDLEVDGVEERTDLRAVRCGRWGGWSWGRTSSRFSEEMCVQSECLASTMSSHSTRAREGSEERR